MNAVQLKCKINQLFKTNEQIFMKFEVIIIEKWLHKVYTKRV